MKIFKFEHSEGAEIVAAENAKEAIMFFFTDFMDDIQTDDFVEFDGIRIKEVTDKEITKKRLIYNEDKGQTEEVSYIDIIGDAYKGKPMVVVTSAG